MSLKIECNRPSYYVLAQNGLILAQYGQCCCDPNTRVLQEGFQVNRLADHRHKWRLHKR